MKILSKPLLLATLAALHLHAGAATTFTFDGNIAWHKDVVLVPFTLDRDTANITVWTDSFMGGTNFDPITSLWRDGTLVFRNDDNPDLKPGQTRYDSGMHFDTLAAGDYVFSIATYHNWNVSTRLADGFEYDSEAPVALADWCQPASQCNMGSYWRVNLEGVDRASPPPVPEPASYAMLLLGLAAPLAGRLRGRGRATKTCLRDS